MNNSSTRSEDVDRLLNAWRDGDVDAFNQLVPILYDKLREIARRRFSREPRNHLLQTTALVHEVYLKLVDDPPKKLENRVHFYCIAARLMRRILVEHARSENRDKRGGRFKIVVTQEINNIPASEKEIDLIQLDDALKKLKQLHPVWEELVEKRYFGGLTIKETAQVMVISEREINRKWNLAKSWLHREMNR